MNYNFTGIVLLLMLVVFFVHIFISWIILFHVKKYSVTKESTRIISVVYLAGSLVFLGFMALNGFSLIETLQ